MLVSHRSWTGCSLSECGKLWSRMANFNTFHTSLAAKDRKPLIGLLSSLKCRTLTGCPTRLTSPFAPLETARRTLDSPTPIIFAFDNHQQSSYEIQCASYRLIWSVRSRDSTLPNYPWRRKSREALWPSQLKRPTAARGLVKEPPRTSLWNRQGKNG